MHHYIPECADALESTAVHPETYPAARALLARLRTHGDVVAGTHSAGIGGGGAGRDDAQPRPSDWSRQGFNHNT